MESSPGGAPAALPRSTHILTLAAVLLLGVLVGQWLGAAFRILAYPYEWSSMDGYFVAYAQRLLAGHAIYSAHSTPPMGFEYVPGYLVALGPLNALFGPGVWVERGLAFALTLGTAAAAGHIVRMRSGSLVWGLIASALCVAPPLFGEWYLVRGLDVLVLVVGLAATFILAEAPLQRGAVVIAAAVLYVLAFYCKQTAIFPWAAGAAIVFVRERRHVPLFLGVSVGLGVAVGVALQAWSGGWFWNNAFATTAQNPFYPRLLLGLLMVFLPWTVLVPGFAAVAAVAEPRVALKHPWALYWVACAASIPLAGKLGAATVYFLPVYIASIIWGCQRAPAWVARLWPRWGAALAMAAIAQLLLWFVYPGRTPDAAGRERAAGVLQAIADRPGPVLTERVDSFATLTGHGVDWEAVQLPILHKIHGMSIDALLEQLRTQQFTVVLYSGQFFSRVPALSSAIFTYYRPLDGYQVVSLPLFYGEEIYSVLVPKPAADLPAPPTGASTGDGRDRGSGEDSEVQ